MDSIFMIILIFIMIAFVFGFIFYIADIFLKKFFKPNEEYLLEMDNLKINNIKHIAYIIISLPIIFSELRVMGTLFLFIFLLIEPIFFLLNLKHLKSKEENINTIKYFIFKSLITALAAITLLAYLMLKIK